MSNYAVPDDPADPETAALDLIVQFPRDVLGGNSPPCELLQELATMLELGAAFSGLTWHDARHAAIAIIFDTIARDNPSCCLQLRADRAIDGSDDMSWDDPVAMSRAMTIGAKVMQS